MPVRSLLSFLLLVLTLSGLPARAQKPAPHPRLETEYKLALPAGRDGAVWRWLSTEYAKTKPRALGPNWSSALGEETFRDRYFDVPAGTLLAARAGLRHRQRFDTAGELTKQLVQLKITNDADGLLREELKFKPVEGATAEMPMLELVRPADKPGLDSALRALGVTLDDVRPAFGLGQRRRRLYLQTDGEAFSTITLDSSYDLAGAPATFTEIEVELNEKRYTGASIEERAQMRVVLDSIRADLFRHIPGLRQDQRPKYQKLAELLATKPGLSADSAAQPPAGPQRIRWATVLIGGALAGGAAAWLLARYRRRKA